MAYCMNCGQQLLDGANFCVACGTAMGEIKTSTSQRKTTFDGEIHKCPNCGEMLNSFTTNCPSCGYEIRSVKTNSPVEELAKKIEQTSSLDRKIELITNFYIPNTKEDIYDFFIFAVSNLEDKWYDTDEAWKAKLEQAYHKAKLSFGNTPEFDYLEKLYNKTRKEVNKRERSIPAIFRRNKIASITTLLIVGGILFIVAGIIVSSSVSFAENRGAPSGGSMLLLMGVNLLISPAWVLEKLKKKEKKTNISSQKKNNISVQSMGKDAKNFIQKNYEDVTEQLKELGFRNIVVKAEKKGLLDTEGAIKGISIAGNSEFSEDDEFDVNSKIIIRFYSKNYKGE